MTAIYLLDTTIWIDLVRTNSEAIRRKLVAHSKSTIGLSVITLCELQFGIERRARRHPHLGQAGTAAAGRNGCALRSICFRRPYGCKLRKGAS